MPVEMKSFQSQAFVDELMEGGAKEVCIVSRDSVEMMLTDSLKLQANQTAIAEKIADSFSRFTDIVEASGSLSSKLDALNENIIAINTTLKESSEALESKLDQVIEILSNRPEQSTIPVTTKTDIESTIRRRNSLIEKVVRSEFLSKYYQELITEATPFAPPKFRTKVLKNTPERDLKHRRQQTINTVNTEIALMQDRIHDWRSQIEDIDKEIEDFLTRNETQRLDITSRTASYEPKYREQFEHKNLAKLKEEYDQDKRMNFDYLITVEEETEEEPTTKNFRGTQDRGTTNRKQKRRAGQRT